MQTHAAIRKGERTIWETKETITLASILGILAHRDELTCGVGLLVLHATDILLLNGPILFHVQVRDDRQLKIRTILKK